MKGICKLCEQVRTVYKNRKSGELICDACRRNPSNHEKCSECGMVKPVAKRNESGKATCSACRNRSNISRCAKCGETKVIQALGLCYGCYQYQRRASTAAGPT